MCVACIMLIFMFPWIAYDFLIFDLAPNSLQEAVLYTRHNFASNYSLKSAGHIMF